MANETVREEVRRIAEAARAASGALAQTSAEERNAALAAMVVTRPFLLWKISVPVFISRKQPVPYVFFASPGAKQVCPKSAACWSPAHPAMGISTPA